MNYADSSPTAVRRAFFSANRRNVIMDPKKELDYSDSIPDDEETERPEPYELTYRDGSAQNECWAGED